MNDELKQLSERVLHLRSGKRRLVYWPIEIKKECVRQLSTGASISAVAMATGIAHKTLIKWSEKTEPQFLQIDVKADEPSFATLEKSFTITFSTGPRIENLTFDDLKFFKG